MPEMAVSQSTKLHPATGATKDASTRPPDEEKFYLWIVVAWLGILLYFNPRLLALTAAAPNPLAAAAVWVFVLCLDYFWFYAVYNAAMIGTSFCWKETPGASSAPLDACPQVAVLYTTRNDFRAEAVEACLALDYPNHHVFILDDSTDEIYTRRIDAWAGLHASHVTVVRRPSKAGFKAGNLNHALRNIEAGYPYFAVCDADGILPAGFLKGLLPFFGRHADAAFVQAAQAANPAQRESFGRDMDYMVFNHYRHFVRARNCFGFVMFYGHGALIRTDAWKAAGGFPEIVTEDLAFAAKARTLGWRGYYTETVKCLEDFPPTYERYRARTEKWIRGTSEFMKLHYGAFLKSPRVPWYEKLDVLAGALSHYQGAVMLLFLLTLGTLLPVYYDNFRYPGSFFLMPVPYGKSPLEYLAHIRYHIFWSPDFYVLMAMTLLVPVVPALVDLRKTPSKCLRYLVASNFVFFGSLVAETAAVLAFLCTGTAVFRNTHDAGLARGGRSFHPNHPAIWVAEFFTGAALVALAFYHRNLWFMAPGIALLLSPAVHVFGWKRGTSVVASLPLATGFVVFFVVTLDLVMSWGGRS